MGSGFSFDLSALAIGNVTYINKPMKTPHFVWVYKLTTVSHQRYEINYFLKRNKYWY